MFLNFNVYNNFFVTPAPKVSFSTAVEALESDLFPSNGGKVKNANSAGWKSGNPHKCWSRIPA
ncbi:Uncharacterized protein FWK35_00027138 [Aphis craccivora]|uniref:Uncharacterized protein n=1 Tax=Aphis craccivora TaxID=307492 RepID=A0A6G0Y2Y2_APHCR|nr:Uncharacterized protein FWK35_00027138 [Aphis craccivora]